MKAFILYLLIPFLFFSPVYATQDNIEPICFKNFDCENLTIENKNLSNHTYSNIKFVNINFNNVNLSHTIFLNSNFENVQFTGNSLLKYIDFSYSHFNMVKFIGQENAKIDLSNANFSSVIFFNSNGLKIDETSINSNAFINCSLNYSLWEHTLFNFYNGTIYFKKSDIKNVDFSKAYNSIDENLKPYNRNFVFIADNSNFENSNFSKLNIYLSIVHDSNFTNTKFINSDVFLGFKTAGFYLTTDKRIVIHNANFNSTIQNSIINFFNIDDYALIDFSGSSFINKTFFIKSLNNSNFTNSNLENVNLKESTLNKFMSCAFCIFTNANLTGLLLPEGGVDFTGAYLNNTKWGSSNIENVNFSHALIYSSNFTNSSLKNSIFTDSTISSSDFSRANLTGVIGFKND